MDHSANTSIHPSIQHQRHGWDGMGYTLGAGLATAVHCFKDYGHGWLGLGNGRISLEGRKEGRNLQLGPVVLPTLCWSDQLGPLSMCFTTICRKEIYNDVVFSITYTQSVQLLHILKTLPAKAQRPTDPWVDLTPYLSLFSPFMFFNLSVFGRDCQTDMYICIPE